MIVELSKREFGMVKRDLGFGNRDLGFGKRDLGFGNRDSKIKFWFSDFEFVKNFISGIYLGVWENYALSVKLSPK